MIQQKDPSRELYQYCEEKRRRSAIFVTRMLSIKKKARKIRFSWSLSKIQIFFVGGLFIFVAFPHFCRCFISTETLMAMFFDTTLLKICVLDISYLLSYCTLQLPPRPPLLRPSIHMAPSNFLRPSITINIDTQHSQKNAY